MRNSSQFLMIAGVIIAAAISFGAEASTKSIAHKYANGYTLIWNDRGSGADRDVSIWRPVDYQAGYYPLGDVAVATHNRPNSVALTVKELVSGSLATPLRFEEIWRDSGSGANEDVKIMKMVPRSGYTCLGHVAIASHSGTPDINKYRCVKSSCVTTGSYQPIWNDKGSGAHRDVGLFSNSEIGSVKAVFANSFTSVASHSQPGGSPYMLNIDCSILHSLIPPEKNKNLAIKVYQGSDSDLIWKDSGSGGRYDISIYRPKGQGGLSVGDIAVNYYSSPRITHSVKAVLQDALAAPVDFRKRWDDSGSGARWDVTFWEPVCPSNYVPLGHVAVRNHHSKPSKSDVSCVKYDHVTVGNWHWVWNDRSTGSDVDVSVYRADAKNSDGQGLQAMGTVPHHGGMDRTAYVLKASVIQYIVGKPATKYIITNVNYLFDDRKILSNMPEELKRSIIENKGSTVVTSRRSVEYAFEETRDWSIAFGLEIGVETSVTAGIPDVASATTTVSTTVTTEQTTGESTSKSHSDVFEIEVPVQPKSQKTVTVVCNRYIADVPYTATLVTEYADGTRTVRNQYKGIYRGVNIAEVRAVVEKDVPLVVG